MTITSFSVMVVNLIQIFSLLFFLQNGDVWIMTGNKLFLQNMNALK